MGLADYKDFTIKAKIVDVSSIKEKLEILGANKKGTDFQKDYYFQIDKGKLKWRDGNIENVIIHYERQKIDGLEQTKVYRYDQNPIQSEIDKLFQNHQLLSMVEKKRDIYTIANIKIHIDTLDNENFLEIEAIDEKGEIDLEGLKNQCFALQQKLNIPDSDLIPTGYS